MNTTQERTFEHINIRRTAEQDSKTLAFLVWSKRNTLLGQVRWYDVRQQHCFFSNGAIVYDADCMRDIATFIEDLNKE